MRHLVAICSDTHGVPPPHFEAAAAILHAGDVYDAAAPQAARLALPELRRWVVMTRVPVFAVRGNHDYADPAGFFAAANDVSGRVCAIAPGLLVAGIGLAAQRYYDLPGEGDLAVVCRSVARQARRLVTAGDRLILLTHYPPRLPQMPAGTPRGSGLIFDCVRELADELRPVVIVQGHVHELFGMEWKASFGGREARIISPGAKGTVIEMEA